MYGAPAWWDFEGEGIRSKVKKHPKRRVVILPDVVLGAFYVFCTFVF